MFAETHCREIDILHEEMTNLAVALRMAPDSDFSALFAKFLAHAEMHFETEEKMMRESGFVHASEHVAEHRQMLQEMRQFQQRRISFVRGYVEQRLPERLNLHIIRLDSLLAAWLKDR